MADKRCFVQFPHPGGEHKPDGSDKIGWNKTRRNNRPNNHKRKFMQFPGKWTAGSPTVGGGTTGWATASACFDRRVSTSSWTFQRTPADRHRQYRRLKRSERAQAASTLFWTMCASAASMAAVTGGGQPSGRAGETKGGRAPRPRPASMMCRCRWGVEGGTAPRQPLPGDPRSVAPKGRLAPDC